VQALYAVQVGLERLEEGVRQHGDAVLGALAVAHDEGVLSEVEVLHSQPQAFE